MDGDLLDPQFSVPNTPRFQLGLGIPAHDYDVLQRRARAAEAGGFSFVAVGDNPALIKDTYVSLTMLAVATDTCRIGTAMTDCVHRDMLVTAAAMSSVESVARGRTFLGISAGRARKPGTMKQLREFVVALRELWERGETEYQGERVTLGWDARPVPVLLGVSGPRGLRMAGEIADGAICEAGVDESTLARVRGDLAAGALAAGRDPEELEIWHSLKTSIAEDPDEAMWQIAPQLAALGAIALGRDPEQAGVPERFRPACRDLAERYDMAAHLRTDPENPNRELVLDPEFRAYVLDRFCLVGSAREWVERLEDLKKRGADRIFCVGLVPDLDRYIDLVGRTVLHTRVGSNER
ncbi:LLM class flavin-dependent oxidoreductase [Streptomyces sp. NPDC096311]|uniref:LLM class flavin-dependent oxidoreductase n=1 Tax=Streptomyces sp. NPDC096311 TaxID=3366083 RepID=UPI003811D363